MRRMNERPGHTTLLGCCSMPAKDSNSLLRFELHPHQVARSEHCLSNFSWGSRKTMAELYPENCETRLLSYCPQQQNPDSCRLASGIAALIRVGSHPVCQRSQNCQCSGKCDPLPSSKRSTPTCRPEQTAGRMVMLRPQNISLAIAIPAELCPEDGPGFGDKHA